jgi:hypothetical protein
VQAKGSRAAGRAPIVNAAMVDLNVDPHLSSTHEITQELEDG